MKGVKRGILREVAIGIAEYVSNLRKLNSKRYRMFQQMESGGKQTIFGSAHRVMDALYIIVSEAKFIHGHETYFFYFRLGKTRGIGLWSS